LELKTNYAYSTILFHLIADSRSGFHGQIDIRGYAVPRGHRDIDELLINRTISLLTDADSARKQLLQESSSSSGSTCFTQDLVENFMNSSTSAFSGDFFVAPVCTPEPLKHLFGSYQGEQMKVCQGFLFQKIRMKLGLTIKQNGFHCEICKWFAG
jgi:hypothetical protein